MWDDADIEDDVKPAATEEGAPAEEASGEAVAEGAEGEAAEEEGKVTKGTDQKLIFKHWVRPKFLQYNYMYDYRHNYYDDCIDYLDRRNRGLQVDTPRAQTWAERALRTYVSKPRLHQTISRDTTKLLHNISSGARFHRYHSKSLISRKYSTLGFNTVSI